MSKIIYCLHCSGNLSRNQFKFCSSSCSASFNNKGRIRSVDSKKKTSDSIRKNMGMNPYSLDEYISTRSKPRVIKTPVIKTKGSRKKYVRVYGRRCRISYCKVCNKQAYGKNHCNKECLRITHSINSSNWLKTNRAHLKNPHMRSYMETSFANWLTTLGVSNSHNGFLEQIHFKYSVNGKIKNGWIDFLFPRIKLIIELDGNHHSKRIELDRIRDKYLSERGYSVMRITHNEFIRKTKIDEVLNVLGIMASPV